MCATVRNLLILLFTGLGQDAMATAPKAPEPFELGVVPYLSTTSLVTAYQPLRTYLEEELKRPVVLTTAPDFITFIERCLRKEYDAIIIGPGLGRLVQTEAGYRPIIVTKRNIKALVIVERNSPYDNPKALSGKRVAMLDPMVVLSQLGMDALRQAGMQPGRDYRIQVVKSPSNAIHAVLQGEVEAGVTTANLVPQLSDDTKHRLRILAESREIPGLMFMLLPTALSRHPRMQDLLLQFERTETGQRFIDALAIDGLRIPEKREMKSMDNFLPEIRKHFKR